jgi:hypothetical protein
MHVQQLPVSLSRTPGTPGPGKGQRFIDAAAAARGCPGYPPSRHSDKMSKVRTAPVALRRRRGPPAAATAGDSRRTVSEHRAPAEASSRRYPICFWSTCRSGNVEISAALPPSKHQPPACPWALTSAYEPACVRVPNQPRGNLPRAGNIFPMVAAGSDRPSAVPASCVYTWSAGKDAIGPVVLAEEAAGQVIFPAYPRWAISGHVHVAFTTGRAGRGLFAPEILTAADQRTQVTIGHPPVSASSAIRPSWPITTAMAARRKGRRSRRRTARRAIRPAGGR